MIKPRTPPGIMELLPRDQIAFQRMLDTIRRTFEGFGFLPIETPVFELSETLLTKSGGETERQVYFVQSTGALEKAADGLPELALRFDLTVPLARYVAEHEHDLAFPFRRYQMQRVYRGERAQRGRFREFYQCDIDVIGKDSLSPRYDAEVPAVISAVFAALDIGEFTIQLNHRKLLRGYFEGQGIDDAHQMTVLREIDKLDKRGEDAVRATLTGEDFGLSGEVADRLLAFSRVRSTGHDDALARLDALGAGTALFEEGRNELRDLLNQVLVGKTMREAAESLSVLAARAPADIAHAAQRATGVLIGTLVETTSDRLLIAGAGNLTLYGMGDLHGVIDALEEQVVVLKLLASAQELEHVSVRIGSENEDEELSRAAVVTTAYGAGAEALGGLGVVGPTHMDYPGTIQKVAAVAGYISRILSGE